MSLTMWAAAGVYGILVAVYCFQKKFSSRLGRILSKLLCSSGFLAIAVLSLGEASPTHGLVWKPLLFMALVFSALGDFLLSLQKGRAGEKALDCFTLGGASFFIAHVLFSILFNFINGFQAAAVIFGLCTAGFQFFMLRSMKKKLALFQVFSVIYLAALGFMAMSGGLFLLRYPLDVFSILTAAGAMLFFLSDLILCAKLFWGAKAGWPGPANTVAYFGGQLLFALTILFV